MAITSAICTSFKQEILVEGHNLTNGADSIKLALYTSSATLGAGTTAFVTTGQATGTNYSSGGSALTNVTPTTSGTTAIVDFADFKSFGDIQRERFDSFGNYGKHMMRRVGAGINNMLDFYDYNTPPDERPFFLQP